MSLQACEAYYTNGRFVPLGLSKLKEGTRAVIMILDNEDPEFEKLKKEAQDKEREARLAWIQKLESLIDAGLNEPFPFLERKKDMRPPINFSDEAVK